MDMDPDPTRTFTDSPAEDILAALADRGFYLLGLSPGEQPDGQVRGPEDTGKLDAAPPGSTLCPDAQACPGA